MLYPIVLNRINTGTGNPVRSVEVIAILVAILVVFMHRENIKRLYQGKESKLKLGKKKKDNEKSQESQKDQGGEND